MPKLLAKSKNGKMIKVGNSATENSPWYFMTAPVMETINTFNDGEEVTIETKSEGGNKYVTKITKGSSGTPVATTPTAVTPPVNKPVVTGATPDKGVTSQAEGFLSKEEWMAKKKADGTWVDHSSKPANSPEINASIKKQAIMHATSRTLISMQGIVTPDNVCELIDKIYQKYTSIVG